MKLVDFCWDYQIKVFGQTYFYWDSKNKVLKSLLSKAKIVQQCQKFEFEYLGEIDAIFKNVNRGPEGLV